MSATKKGKASFPVYIYLVPKKKLPEKVRTKRPFGADHTIFYDYDITSDVILGYEFLDCYGVDIGGKNVSK